LIWPLSQWINDSFAIAILSQSNMSLAAWFVVNVFLLGNFNKSFNFLTFLNDSDVDVGSNL
jgi:hypothetical protein